LRITIPAMNSTTRWPPRANRSYTEEAGAEVDEGRALIEALYLAVAILHDRLSGHGASMRI
jgi:hypothetical protein